jgi:DNA polymerase-3 subunit epsilon
MGTALVVDIETTGIDTNSCEVVQLSMLLMRYSLDGDVLDIGTTVSLQQQPSQPMSGELVDIIGIRNEDVAGKRIDPRFIASMVRMADLIVAHHADFVRPIVQRTWPIFRQRRWGCSLAHVPWLCGGHNSTDLAALASRAGLVMTDQDRGADCRLVAELLASKLPRSGATALLWLLIWQVEQEGWLAPTRTPTSRRSGTTNAS